MDNNQPQSQIIIYTNETGKTKIDVRFDGDTVWLTQKMMAELFDVETNTINYHLKEIFKSDELNENSVIRKIRTTASDGKFTRSVPLLDKERSGEVFSNLLQYPLNIFHDFIIRES